MLTRTKVNLTAGLAAIGTAHLALALTDRTAAWLMPLSEWRPLASVVLAIPLAWSVGRAVILPARRAALAAVNPTTEEIR